MIRKGRWHFGTRVRVFLAQAVKRLYPEAKCAVGAASESGFYYDFDFGGGSFSEENLADVEAEMKEIVKEFLIR